MTEIHHEIAEKLSKFNKLDMTKEEMREVFELARYPNISSGERRVDELTGDVIHNTVWAAFNDWDANDIDTPDLLEIGIRFGIFISQIDDYPGEIHE